ncbi:MAG: DUF1194 domain-containing protein [Alphaproteobacteria bacterium]|nr:DUF1194 domain-containing protein [Alphaproteobacteria bacterium]
MRQFAAAALLLLALALPAAARELVDLELVLAADGSGSIDEDEFRLQRDGYAAAITSPQVLSAIRSGITGRIALALIEWGAPDSQPVIVDWMVIKDAASAQAFAERLRAAPRQAYGYNSISNAVHRATEMIETNDFVASRKVIDVSGDGPQIGGRPLEAVRRATVNKGITINALVIAGPGGGFRGPGGMTLGEHYERDVIGGNGAFVITAATRHEFAKAILQKLVLEVAGEVPPTRYAGP